MEIASSKEALAGKAGRLLKMIAGVEPHLVSHIDTARRIVNRHFDKEGGLIEDSLGGGGYTYLIRGKNGGRVSHDGRFWYCDRAGHASKMTCPHILACWALARAAGARVPFPVPDECARCGGKFPSREVISVEERDHPSYFEGDLLCINCAADAAVA